MQKRDMLISGWDAAFDKEGWYPPLRAALKNVDYRQSTWKAPGKASHSIGELTDHLLYYKKRFLFRLENKTWTSKIDSNDETFHAKAGGSSENWEQSVRELELVHQKIRKKIIDLSDNDLDSKLPEIAVDAQLLTLIMHDAYHTGQIVFIRKLYGSWPAVRET